MKMHEIMTAHARCISPENTLVEAAGLMRELDVGALPVCENDHLVGILTDRDITLRGTADGRDPNSTTVREVMSNGVASVRADQEVEEAVRVMEQRQIRRLPVLGRNDRIVGIVSLGDIAISSSPAFSGMALRDVSQQRHPSTRQRRLVERSEPPRLLTGSAPLPSARKKSTGAATVKSSSRSASVRKAKAKTARPSKRSSPRKTAAR